MTGCIGLQLPYVIHEKQYNHLPLLFLFPVSYTTIKYGRIYIEKEEKSKKEREEREKIFIKN